MKLKEISFHLENCDMVTIDGKYIGDFLVDKIETNISRCACNAIDRMDVAKTFAIEIHKDADKVHYELGNNDWETTVFKRLSKYNDITQIDFTLIESYVDEGKDPKTEDYHYFVDWCGDDDYSNEAQINYVSDIGHFYIVIKENGKIDDFFMKEEINDAKAMNFKFEMYDVGDENNVNKTCKDCKKFTGAGDWNLCCMEKHEGYPYGFLCYEDTLACEKFEEKEE